MNNVPSRHAPLAKLKDDSQDVISIGIALFLKPTAKKECILNH